MLPSSVLRSGKSLLDREERSKGRRLRGGSVVGGGQVDHGSPFHKFKGLAIHGSLFCCVFVLFCKLLQLSNARGRSLAQPHFNSRVRFLRDFFL